MTTKYLHNIIVNNELLTCGVCHQEFIVDETTRHDFVFVWEDGVDCPRADCECCAGCWACN